MGRISFAYIMGHGFSGSTLLTFLLGSHPEIATFGEMGIAPRAKTAPEEFLCSCRVPIRECYFWQRVTEEMARRGHDFDICDARLEFRAPGEGMSDVLLRAVQRGPVLEALRRLGIGIVPGAGRALDRLLQRHEDLVRVVSELRGTTIFLDSSKRPERAVFMLRIPAFDVRVIHLVRDGRAVSYSSMKNLSLGPREAAHSWRADNRAAERARRNFAADRWLRVRHEDLCARPEQTLAQICRFIGVTPERIGTDFRSVEQHIIGNRMRLDTTSEIRLDERWKQALTPADLMTIERIVAGPNRRYGYGPL